VRIVDPHLPADFPGDKEGILDVKVKTTAGQLIDVEIQVAEQSQMRERIVFYLARMAAGQIGRGEDYREIKRSICILITDYVQIPENRNYHNRYRLYDPRTRSEFTDLLEVDTLELPKLPPDADGTGLWDWLTFLNARKEEEFTMLAEKNPQVGQAVSRLAELSQDERTRLLAESREKLQRDIAANKFEATRQAEKKTQLAIARNLLQMSLPVEKIMEATGLAREEIQSLLH
jgi:predicted transposase/invertase (TIGR01784 family)